MRDTDATPELSNVQHPVSCFRSDGLHAAETLGSGCPFGLTAYQVHQHQKTIRHQKSSTQARVDGGVANADPLSVVWPIWPSSVHLARVHHPALVQDDPKDLSPLGNLFATLVDQAGRRLLGGYDQKRAIDLVKKSKGIISRT